MTSNLTVKLLILLPLGFGFPANYQMNSDIHGKFVCVNTIRRHSKDNTQVIMTVLIPHSKQVKHPKLCLT